MKMDFNEVCAWMGMIYEQLASDSYIVEYNYRMDESASARMRIEKNNLVGEISVWPSGMTSIMIIDLDKEEFIFERDGIILREDWKKQLSYYIELLK